MSDAIEPVRTRLLMSMRVLDATISAVRRGRDPSEAPLHHRRATYEALLAAVIVGAIVVISLHGLWRSSEGAIVGEMRRGLMRLAVIAASTVDPELHDQLRDPAQIDTPLYDRAIEGLRRARQSTPGVKFMYTIVRDGSQLRFVLDAAEPGDHDGDGREDRAQLWEEYRQPDDELFFAIGPPDSPGRPAASLAPHCDEWGTFMTGYAPILDGLGHQHGVVGVDIAADEYFAQMARIRGQVILGLAPGAALTMGIGLGVFLLRRHQLALLRAAEEGERRAIALVRRVADSERRFRTLADSAPMLIWSADREGRRDFANKPWCDFVGRSVDSELGEAWMQNIHPDDREATRRDFRSALQERRTFISEYRLRRHDGAYRLVLDKGVPRVIDGAFDGFIGAGMDITELRRAEDELKRAYLAAQSADQAKSGFLANMSHEIRTPLTTILGYAEVLRSDGDMERAPAPRLQAIDAIRTAGEHLLSIINDVLDFSKIEAGCMRVERVATDLAKVLRDCVEFVRFKIREKGLSIEVRFETPMPAEVISDPTRLRQIILNLLSNAVKFTRVGGVVLRCRHDGDQLSIEVADTGVGLDSTQVESIFKPFSQGDASITRTHGGTGLGLAICRRLATLMGGSVSLLASEPGKGSCFKVRVPAPPSPGMGTLHEWPITSGTADRSSLSGGSGAVPSSGSARAPTITTLSARVLLVEDGIDNRRLISLLLARAGARVVTAEHGLEALERIDDARTRGSPFDLIVTDIQMPTMDGLTLVRRLRARGDATPIIGLSAQATTDEREAALEAGCDDFATKPIDRALLIETCRRRLCVEGARGVGATTAR